jgi:hypothetical protein
MKHLVLVTLFCLPCLAATKPELALQTSSDMQHLWNSSAVWTREYLIDLALDLPNSELAAKQLMSTQQEIGKLLEPLYGKEKAATAAELLKKQASLTIALIDAAKKKDAASFTEAQANWKKNSSDLSLFLARTNPYIKYHAFNDLLQEYLTTITTMTTDYLQKNWETDIINYDTLRSKLNTIGFQVGKALTDAFPKPPEKLPAPKPQVTVPLPAGMSIRKTK